jgi:phospholipid/cholesterol/gamma-HCH transport system substrate-binding protein
MVSIRWTAIKLGLFTAVTIAVTIWLAAIIGNLHLFSSPYAIEAEFADATGLLKGDVVKAAGVDVGRVSDIRIENGLAVVTISIDEGVDLPGDLAAQIRFRNLVGQRMVTLIADASSGGRTEAGDTITLDRTRPAFDLTVLFNGLRPLIRSTSPHDINLVSRALTQALQGREDDVDAVLQNIGAIADTLSSRDSELTELLDGLNVVTSDLSGRDAQLRSTLADINEFLGDISATRSDLSEALVTLDDAATRFGRVVDKSGANIQAEVGDLAILLDAVNDKRQDLRTAVRSLPRLLLAIERGTSYGEWANLQLINACKDDSGTCGRRGT